MSRSALSASRLLLVLIVRPGLIRTPFRYQTTWFGVPRTVQFSSKAAPIALETLLPLPPFMLTDRGAVGREEEIRKPRFA